MASSFDPLDHVEKPWGSYDVVFRGDDIRVKVLTLKPGTRLSDQRHRHRSEYWLIGSGAGTAHLEFPDGKKETITLDKGGRVTFEKGTWHRASVPEGATADLVVVEVWKGDELAEDDIERRADDYGRSS